MSLKVISWNINMFNISSEEFQIRCPDIVDELVKKSKDCDIIVLIESSYPFLEKLKMSEIKKRFSLLDKLSLSHGGITNILFNKSKIKNISQVPIGDNMEVPVLLIRFMMNEGTYKKDYFLGGCHLAPFPENTELRLQQLILARTAVPPDKPLILIGDMNIREKESKLFEKDDIFNMKDSGDKKKTWFRAFFEKNSPISSRFDRLYYSSNLELVKFDLFGRIFRNNKFELLSDHLAIKSELKYLNK
tara:strand:- start:5062 stop:5799 length:738 start_codon:yes stop_codon:yes gene_type:complete